MDKTKKATLKDIEEGLDKLALIIMEHGERYLPLFECLHDEREKMLHQNTTLVLARKRAEKLGYFATQKQTQTLTQTQTQTQKNYD